MNGFLSYKSSYYNVYCGLDWIATAKLDFQRACEPTLTSSIMARTPSTLLALGLAACLAAAHGFAYTNTKVIAPAGTVYTLHWAFTGSGSF